MSTQAHSSRLPDGRVVVRIGTCGGKPEAFSHVEALLAKAGIQAFLHGSRAYAIEVFESDAIRAAELLQSDPQRDECMITVYEVQPSSGPNRR